MDISEQCNYYIQVPMYRIISVAFYVFANANSLFSSEISIPQNNSDSRKPVIIEAPTDLITTESILEFTCKAKGNPNPLIVWYNASTGRPLVDKLQTIGYQTSVHVNKHLGQLMISNPTPGKSYRVYCNATNSAGWMISEPPATGAIAFLNSEFRLHPSDIEADEGTSVTLECLPPIGLPKPNISWIKDNKTIITDDKLQNSQDSYLSNIRITAGGNLKIHPTNVEDTGNYICAALNLVGQRLSHSAYVNIKPRDYNYKTSKLIRARQGEQVKLFCPDTKDKPVKWKRKLKQLTVTSNRIEQRKTMLIIRHAVFSDSDIYICTTLDGKESEVRLTVETPPIFLKSPTDLTLNLGDKAIFPCVADGYPKPGIYWELPDKSPVFPTDNLTEDTSNKYKVHVDGTLEITSVTFKDAGKYHCIAHSSVDMVQTSATLRIQRRKKNSMPASNHSRVLNKLKEVVIEMNSSKFLKYVPPYIGLPPSNKTQVVGESVLIDCELPRLVRIVSPGKLQNVDNLGHNYRKVFDIQSTENWEISWRRAVLLHTNMNQLTYEMIHGKNVRFKILQSGSLQINDLQISDSGIYTCQVKDETNVKYEVAVHLSVLFSKPKEAISDYLQEYPLSAPNNLQVMNTTDRSITLSWNPPFLYSTDGQSRSILPMNYWIEIYTPERSDEGWMAVERTWPVNLITLNGISSDIPYYIIVRARLGEGRVGWASDPFGPIFTKTSKIYSKYTSRRPDSSMEQLALKPVELRNIQLTVLSPKSIHVSWNVFEMPSILSRVNGYIIYYRSVEHVRCLNDKYLQTGPNDANFVNNYCSLNPENYHKSSGVNEIYNRLELMRQIYQEEQENNITDSVTSLPGVISTVTIEAHYTKGVQDSKESQPINHKVTSLLTELRPFRCYEVGIKAFHEKVSVSYLETRDIFTHTALTYETSPMSAPRNIFAGWLFGGNLELGWTAPPVSEWNGIILGYIVYIHDEVLKTYQNVNVSSEGRKITISLNSLPKAFSIQLAAYTCVGIGVRSESLKIDTNQNIFSKSDRDLSTLKTTENLRKSAFSVLTEYSSKDEKLVSQPWFISAMISSLLAWCVIFGMCALCWTRRNKFCKKRLTYQISQPNFQYSTPSDDKHCKSKLNNMDEMDKCCAIQHIRYPKNQMSNASMTISVSSGDQTTDAKIHPHVSYLPIRQPSENTSNGSPKNYGLRHLEYCEEPRIGVSKPQPKPDRFRPNIGTEGIPTNTNSNMPQMFQTFSRRFTPNSPTNIAYFSSENQDPIKTNSSHLTSASQTSSEPFDSAIYLEQIPNRLHFNDSSGSALTPPTVMTALNGETSDCCNGKTYSPVVTPYATASIIQSQNHDTMLQSPKQQVQPNNNISLNDTINPMEFCPQNMYITCMDLSNCQKAMIITNTGGMECS